MPDFSKIDLWSFVALLLPGLMLVQGYSLGRDFKFRPIGKDDLIVYPVFSLLYALYLWWLGYALQTGQTIFNMEPNQLVWRYCLAPAVAGGLAGLVARFDLFRRLFEPFGLLPPEPPAPPPIRTPWPVVAPQIAVGTYLMVILKDKTIYRALVTEDSLLSSDQDKIDLYLGQTFEGENWVPSSPQRAVYIRGSEIQSIEIWKFSGASE